MFGLNLSIVAQCQCAESKFSFCNSIFANCKKICENKEKVKNRIGNWEEKQVSNMFQERERERGKEKRLRRELKKRIRRQPFPEISSSGSVCRQRIVRKA